MVCCIAICMSAWLSATSPPEQNFECSLSICFHILKPNAYNPPKPHQPSSLHQGLTPCLSQALWQTALMTDNVCNYQPSVHEELMKNQTSAPLLIWGPLFPLIHSEWWLAVNEASLDAAATLTGLTVIKTAI